MNTKPWIAACAVLLSSVALGHAQDIPTSAAISAAAPATTGANAGTAQAATATDLWLRTLEEASKTWTRHLPAATEELLLQGEHAVKKIPLYFTLEEASRATELRVAAISAVSALPEASMVLVYLNGQRVGSLTPNSSTPSRLSMPLQTGQLVEGFNELMFVATHQHRIDCTLEGTYELWTRILPEATAFIGTSSNDTTLRVSALPALLGQNVAPSTLRVTQPAELDGESATRLGRLVNAVVLNGWIANPKLVADGRSGGPGIGLKIMGTAPTSQKGLASYVAFADAPNLYLERSASGETTALVLAGAARELDRELDRLEDKARARTVSGTNEGRAALVAAFGGEMADGGQMTFASLGIESTDFVGRRYTLDIPALLPGDYYQAEYGSVLLYLDGSYAGNLLPRSALTVKVNGVETATLPLDGGPTTFRSQEVRVPLSFFHAGMNTLTLEADLRTEADLACAPESAAVRTPRFQLLNSSRVVIPTMARVGVVPNLAATMSHGFPYTQDEAPTNVFVTGVRENGLSSALSVLAEISANAQRVERFDIVFRPPTEDEFGMVIGAPSSLPLWAKEMIGVEVESETPIRDEAGELFVSEAYDDEPRPLLVAEAAGDTATDALPLREALSQSGSRATSYDAQGLVEGAKRRFEAVVEWLRAGSDGKLEALRDQSQRFTDLVLNRQKARITEREYLAHDVVFAQKAHVETKGFSAVAAAVMPHEPPRTWTVIAAADPALVGGAVDGIAPMGVAFNPSGQHYVFSEARDKMIPAGEAGVLYATRSPGLGNLRLILAGWLSSNVQIYLYLIVSSVGLLGLLTYLTVRNRRAERAS